MEVAQLKLFKDKDICSMTGQAEVFRAVTASPFDLLQIQ